MAAHRGNRAARAALFASVVAVVDLSTAPRAHAQVNTEPLRKQIKAQGWSVSVQGSLDVREGNTNGIDASGGGGVGFATGRHLAFLFGSAELARYSGVDSIDNSFLHARYDYEVLSWLWDEVFVQLQSDKFQRILLRNLYGVGPRFALYQSPSLDLFYGTSYMIEHDAIDVMPGTNDRSDYWESRWNNYLSANYTLDSRVSFASTIYVQPRIVDFTSRRILEETALTFKITKVLAASITGSYRYDSDPPIGVRSVDVDLKNVLSLTF